MVEEKDEDLDFSPEPPENKGIVPGEKDEGIEPKEKVDISKVRNLIRTLRREINERDEKLKDKDKAIKEKEFDLAVSKAAGKFPDVETLKDKIKEKVNQGTPVDDAVISVLYQEGKLTSEKTEGGTTFKDEAGGSAETTGLKSPVKKTPQDMTEEELLAAIREAEAKGEISR